MIKRLNERSATADILPVDLQPALSHDYGTSVYLGFVSLGLTTLCGIAWLIHSDTLRAAMKVDVEETKYNLCCRM